MVTTPICHLACRPSNRSHSHNHAKCAPTAWHTASPELADLAESVRGKVVQRMRQTPVLKVSSTDEGSSDEEELIDIPTKKKALMLGQLRTADSLV